MDSASLGKFRALIASRSDLSCDESLFKKMPSICYLDENGESLCLKPQDYIYEMATDFNFQDLPSYIRNHIAFTPDNLPNFFQRNTPNDRQCMLAIGDSGEKNMHVFGMQWFRSHWFGFDTVSSAISWSAHDGNCNPPRKDFHLTVDSEGDFRDSTTRLQMFDPFRIR